MWFREDDILIMLVVCILILPLC